MADAETVSAAETAGATSAGGTITVRCKLVGDLRRFMPAGERGQGTLQLTAPATVDDVLERLELPARDHLTVGVNGTLTGHDTALSEGDELTIVSPMEGGDR